MSRSLASSERLTFGIGNAKLQDGTYTFSLPAGKTCPGACDCLAHVDEVTKIVDGVSVPAFRLVDGKKQKFRCFAASMEAGRPSVYHSRQKNLRLLREAGGAEQMADLITASIPTRAQTVRVHVGGDFFTADYFIAWMEAARRLPHVLFYAYTKSLHIWTKYSQLVPSNFVLTASRGGRHDHYIDSHGLREAVVVMHTDEAKRLKLKIDHDDNCARNPRLRKFALLIHGQQPAKSAASLAMSRMRAEGVAFGYNKDKVHD